MVTSNDEITRRFVNQMISDEGNFRKVVKTEEGERSCFNDWKIEEGKIIQESDNMTSCAAVKAARAANRLNLELTTENGYVKVREPTEDIANQNEWNIIRRPKEARKQINKLIKERHFESLRRDKTHGHAFMDTKIKESHAITSKPDSVNNNLYKFTIGARVNCLATPANVAFHNGNATNPNCPVCGTPCTLFHILNSCTSNFTSYTWRHNLIVHRLRTALEGKFSNVWIDESNTIKLNELDSEDSLSDDNKNLRPDLKVIDRDKKKIYLIEVTIPYGDTHMAQNGLYSLTDKYLIKKRKYEDLVMEINQKTDYECSLHVVVISSLGVIFEETPNELKKFFNKSELKDLLIKCSHDAILGSAVIFSGKDPSFYGSPIDPPNKRPDAPVMDVQDRTAITTTQSADDRPDNPLDINPDNPPDQTQNSDASTASQIGEDRNTPSRTNADTVNTQPDNGSNAPEQNNGEQQSATNSIEQSNGEQQNASPLPNI